MSAADVPVAAAIPAQPSAAPAARRPRLVMPLLLIAAYWIGWLVVTLAFPPRLRSSCCSFADDRRGRAADLVSGLQPTGVARSAVDRAGAGGEAAWRCSCDGSMGFGLLMYALPVALTAVVVWLVIMRGAPTLTMRLGLLAAALASWGYFTLLRIDGVDGNLSAQRSWRWDDTAEQKRLAELGSSAPAPRNEPLSLAAVSAADWPEFRGPARDGVVRGTHFDPDWKAHPPRELWRRRIGPGWASFATVGNVAFTQEQRGQQEAVMCFDLETGAQVWDHLEEGRFSETVSGAGPRATPTFQGGRLYTQGASGRLNCLDAATGKRIWSRDILADANPHADKKPKDEPKLTPPQWDLPARRWSRTAS
jgi:hypothetical protein